MPWQEQGACSGRTTTTTTIGDNGRGGQEEQGYRAGSVPVITKTAINARCRGPPGSNSNSWLGCECRGA